jgi:hypothetical protein
VHACLTTAQAGAEPEAAAREIVRRASIKVDELPEAYTASGRRRISMRAADKQPQLMRGKSDGGEGTPAKQTVRLCRWNR